MKKAFIFLIKIGIIGLVYFGSKWCFSKNTIYHVSDFKEIKTSNQPFVILSYLGNPNPSEIQWFTKENQTLLTSNAKGELRDFCKKTFHAGMDSNRISLEGQSRGASGVLFYAFNYTKYFSSFIANAYVSDYTLNDLKKSALKNQSDLQNPNFKLRIEIGDNDSFEKKYKRKGSQLLTQFLNNQNIPHEYEIIKDADHWYRDFWNHYREKEKELNGLFHIKFHQKSNP